MGKTIIWIINRLSDTGGGEKLLLEGAIYYRSLGYRVVIVTWDYNDRVLLNGIYENRDIINLNEKIKPRENIIGRALDRIKSLGKLRKIIKDNEPKLIICQGEYDVAITYLATLFTKFSYVFLIFGQIFQYPADLAKYSFVFRRHLHKIRNSQQGYLDTIPEKMPKTSVSNRIANEIISIIRYYAVRKAKSRFVFSKSVEWETMLLFNTDSKILKGAFRNEIFEEKSDRTFTRARFGIPEDKIMLLSFSRLDIKKRIDVIIDSLKYLDERFVLVIAGKGPDKDRLEDIAREYREDRVKFLGFIDETDANPLKASSDLFISMDIGDFDISPFEAMALGVKAIMPIELDVDENLASFSNFYSVRATPEELSKTINKAIADRPSDKVQDYMKIYTWENYFQSIYDYSI